MLREKIESATKFTDWVFAALVIVLGVGTLTSLFSWAKYEFWVSKHAEERTNQLHDLAVRGETASQQRSQQVHEAFLSGSRETLVLVNATLTLAKEASERAARAVEARARNILQELDRDSKELLFIAGQDDRALVTDPAKTATLRSLAQPIEGFQITRLVLPEEMQLSPECLFIRGMAFHLMQQYDDAFKAWREVTYRNETPIPLRSRAWYWIGYEQNNLGHFSDACSSIQSALDTAVGVRKFELQRLLIESKFFNKEQEEALLNSLEALLASTSQSADEGVDPVRKRIVSTMGNICLQMGNKLRIANSLPDAMVKYIQAKEHFQKANGQDKWALFGFAEALYWLGEDGAQKIFKDQVRPKAIDEEIRRIEPRTKVLAKTTELICCIRVPELRSEVPAICSQVTEALGRVEGRLTVYSQTQRRNVTKEDFRKDLQGLMDEYKNPGAAIQVA